MPTQPHPSRGSPPRRALHERTDSHTNEGASSTLRMVGEPQASIYTTSPYPTKPSQILSPSGHYALPQATLKDTPYRHIPLTSPHAAQPQDRDILSAANPTDYTQQGSDAGEVSETSSADVSFYTPSPMKSTPGLSSRIDRSEKSFAAGPTRGLIRKVSDDEPLQFGSAMATAAPNSQSNQIEAMPDMDRQPANKDSDNSLSSTNSTGTMIVRKTREGKKRASYSAFPNTSRPSSPRSNISSPVSQRSIPLASGEIAATGSPGSPSTPVSATFPASSESRILSTPEANTPNYVQYPIIKPPSASGSWAESSLKTPQKPSRALNRAQDRWNPHLSTVQSEGTPSSASVERTSQSMWFPDSSRASKASSTFFSPRMSPDLPPVPARDSADHPTSSRIDLDLTPLPSPPLHLPAPPPVRQRDVTGSTIRVVHERKNRALDLPTTIPGSRDSEPITPNAPEGRKSVVVTRPGSRASFFRDSIPAWAKAYYARPGTSSSISKNGQDHRTSASTDDNSLNIDRLRNRAPRSNFIMDRRISGLSMHPTRPQSLDLAGIRGPSRRRISPTRSPHLWHDRASLGRRRSLFMAPSVDEQAEGYALTKRNVQIVLFALGFIFPPGWFIASVLPLPPRPVVPSTKGKDALRHTQVIQDLEKQLGPTDEARYENARWWRIINRIMCSVGLAIIIVIVSPRSIDTISDLHANVDKDCVSGTCSSMIFTYLSYHALTATNFHDFRSLTIKE